MDFYDRIGRRCECSDGVFIKCCRVRRDYNDLSSQERLNYINIFLQIIGDPVYNRRYTALIDTYTNSFSNGITQTTTPSVSQYFMFNRYFLLEFEDLLKDFNNSLTIPYYDWTPFPTAPYTAAVWGNTDGFGDTSRASDGCVSTGPVRVGEYRITPLSGGGCLKRAYRDQLFPSRATIERNLLPLPASEFAQFHRFLHLFVGINVQCFVGGTMCSNDTANDPIYLLHIAQLDFILTRWQSFGQGRESVRYGGDQSTLLGAPRFRVEQFIDNFALPYNTCLVYDPPILLKNHAPPSSSVFGDSPSARMDCNPMDEIKAFTSMSGEDESFMQTHCPS